MKSPELFVAGSSTQLPSLSETEYSPSLNHQAHKSANWMDQKVCQDRLPERSFHRWVQSNPRWTSMDRLPCKRLQQTIKSETTTRVILVSCFGAGIIGNELVGPFRVPDGFKMNALTYRNFLQDNFIPWSHSKCPAFRKNIIFMQDNAPSHAAPSTVEYLTNVGFKSEKLITWSSSPPDLNPKNLLKKKLYTGSKQYASKDELWDSILQSAQSIVAEEIENLTTDFWRFCQIMETTLIRV